MAKSRWEIENQGSTKPKAIMTSNTSPSSCQQSGDRLLVALLALTIERLYDFAIYTVADIGCPAAHNCFSLCGSIFPDLAPPTAAEAQRRSWSPNFAQQITLHGHLSPGLNPMNRICLKIDPPCYFLP